MLVTNSLKRCAGKQNTPVVWIILQSLLQGQERCGRQNKGPCPNPQHLWICYLTGQKGLFSVIKDLEMGR